MTDTTKLDTLAARTQDKEAITTPSMWAITSGKTKQIKADTLFRIAGALRANPEWIRTGTGDPFKAGGEADEEVVKLFRALPDDKKSMILAAIKAIA